MINVPIENILPNPEQPRRHFDPAALNDLAASIIQHGIIHSIVVEDAGNGKYILHDGERRLRAAKLAQLKEVPVEISPPLGGDEAKEKRLVRALVANIQTEELNPVEEGRAFQCMLEDLGMNQNRIAITLGTNSARVNGRLTLLKLDPAILELVSEGKLSHDKRLTDALLSLPDRATRVTVARKIVSNQMSINNAVKMIEKLKEHLGAERMEKNVVPAIWMAEKREGAVRRPVWDSFAAVGKLPPWLLFELSVRKICNEKCSLREIASETTCNECPLVQMVSDLIGKSK